MRSRKKNPEKKVIKGLKKAIHEFKFGLREIIKVCTQKRCKHIENKTKQF
jgi:hypothetical protein